MDVTLEIIEQFIYDYSYELSDSGIELLTSILPSSRSRSFRGLYLENDPEQLLRQLRACEYEYYAYQAVLRRVRLTGIDVSVPADWVPMDEEMLPALKYEQHLLVTRGLSLFDRPVLMKEAEKLINGFDVLLEEDESIFNAYLQYLEAWRQAHEVTPKQKLQFQQNFRRAASNFGWVNIGPVSTLSSLLISLNLIEDIQFICERFVEDDGVDHSGTLYTALRLASVCPIAEQRAMDFLSRYYVDPKAMLSCMEFI